MPLPKAKVTQVANININFNILFFSEKKLEYNTVQLRVYKEEYICMMNNITKMKKVYLT